MTVRELVERMPPQELRWAFWADCVDVSRRYAPLPCAEVRAAVERRLAETR